MAGLGDINVTTIDGAQHPLSHFLGKATLIVNVADQDRRFIHTFGANAAFRAAVGNIDDGALPRHPCRQRCDLVQRYAHVEADSTLRRTTRRVVQHPVSREHLDLELVKLLERFGRERRVERRKHERPCLDEQGRLQRGIDDVVDDRVGRDMAEIERQRRIAVFEQLLRVQFDLACRRLEAAERAIFRLGELAMAGWSRQLYSAHLLA